jgi:acid phosphatase family membrane protein YuiD
VNYILVCACFSWLIAQILKVIINLVKNKKVILERFVGSGGFPSSHSAFVVGGTVATGISEGFGSVYFAIVSMLACVVIYDALNVRYQAGEHAKALNVVFEELPQMLKLLKEKDAYIKHKERFKEYLGHTPFEVLGGITLGVILPFIVQKLF